MNKKAELEKSNQKIKNCKKCSLWKTRINTVSGKGPDNVKIMIISEAPGHEEDLTGLPFMGRAGKLLDKLLDSIKLKREEIYITNVIKCRPPKNRKPTKKEIETCLPYLKKQIKIINPQKFILLGEVAFSVFFPKEKLKDFRGKWITLQQAQGKKKYFITYHPAAGLRFPRIRTCLQRDFIRFRQNLERSAYS